MKNHRRCRGESHAVGKYRTAHPARGRLKEIRCSRFLFVPLSAHDCRQCRLEQGSCASSRSQLVFVVKPSTLHPHAAPQNGSALWSRAGKSALPESRSEEHTSE